MNVKKRILLLFLCCILLFSYNTQHIQAAGGSSSSNATTISIDSSHADSLSAGGERWYKFKTSNGGGFNILSTGRIDVRVTLYKKNWLGQLKKLETNDNSKDTLNFRLETSLSSNTTYYIKVDSTSKKTTGKYCLKLEENCDCYSSLKGGSWRFQKGSPDPDGPYVTVNKIVYLPPAEASGYYIMLDGDFYKLRDMILDMPISVATTQLTARYKFLGSGAIGFIIGQAYNYKKTSLTDYEKKL